MKLDNKIIVVSHDRPEGEGRYDGELFYTKEAARKFLENVGFVETDDFKWTEQEDGGEGIWVYFNRSDYIELVEKEINE
jgi:hypothetical protein